MAQGQRKISKLQSEQQYLNLFSFLKEQWK
jgi:hypothetical protein